MFLLIELHKVIELDEVIELHKSNYLWYIIITFKYLGSVQREQFGKV